MNVIIGLLVVMLGLCTVGVVVSGGQGRRYGREMKAEVGGDNVNWALH